MEPKLDEATLPSATQLSSYLDHFFEERGPNERHLRRATQRKLVTVQNWLTSILQVPQEPQNMFLFLELPRKLLEIISAEFPKFGEPQETPEEWKKKVAEESRLCFEMTSLTITQLNNKITDLTKKIAKLHLDFKNLVGEKIQMGNEKMQTLEKALPDLPQMLKANIFEQKHSGRLIRKPVRGAGRQGK